MNNFIKIFAILLFTIVFSTKLYCQDSLMHKIIDNSNNFILSSELTEDIETLNCIWVITIDKHYKNFNGVRFSISYLLDTSHLDLICPSHYFYDDSNLFLIQSKNLDENFLSQLGFDSIKGSIYHLVEKYVPNLPRYRLFDQNYRIIKIKRSRIREKDYSFPRKLPKSLSMYCNTIIRNYSVY